MDAEERKALKEQRRLENRARHEAGIKARKPIGTPTGNKQRIQEFKERLLSAPVGESIIRKVIEVAQNDEHPGQIAALKMCMDRLLPTSLFEEKKDGARTAIQITISGIGGNTVDGDVLDAEIVDGA